MSDTILQSAAKAEDVQVPESQDSSEVASLTPVTETIQSTEQPVDDVADKNVVSVEVPTSASIPEIENVKPSAISIPHVDVSTLIAEQVQQTASDLLAGQDQDTTALIAEATAAAIEAGSTLDDDVTAAAHAAALAAASAAFEIEASGTVVMNSTEDVMEGSTAAEKKNEQRRKRYREKTLDDGNNSRTDSKRSTGSSHSDLLASRRLKDRERYANMTPEQRMIYNAKRREQYHRQNEISRMKRRERERIRYHTLSPDKSKERNARRAKLERERYQRLKPEDLEGKARITQQIKHITAGNKT